MQIQAGMYSSTYFHHLFNKFLLPVSENVKCRKIQKNTPQPEAANLLQNRHIVLSGADMAIAKPNDHMKREIAIAKKSRFVIDFGFE